MLSFTLRPRSARYDEEMMEIVFVGEFGDRPVRCAITLEAVADHLGEGDPAAMKAMCERRRRVFEAMFGQRLRRHQVDPDGTVRIRSGDLHGTGIGPA